MTGGKRERVRQLLSQPGTILMDGGMGTTLEDRGTECWSALWSSLALLSEGGLALNDRIHAEFSAAGAEILIANTHNASLAACRAFLDGDGPPVEELPSGPPGARALALLERIHDRAIRSCRRAVPVGSDTIVAAGVGSVEGPYATTSRLTTKEAVDGLAPQVRAIRDRAVDLVLFETLTTASEIEAAAMLARDEGFPPFGAGLTCGPDARTLAGVSMAHAWELLRKAAPKAVFIQCTRYDLVEPALRELHTVVAGASMCGVYANDGRVWEGRVWHGERVTPEEYAEVARRWRDAGARIIGGCCGTTPDHVRVLRRRLD